MPMEAWETVDRDGVCIAIRDFGGIGSPLLIVHGLAGQANEWSESVSWLTLSHRVFALDEPAWYPRRLGRFHRSVHDPVMMTGAHMQPNRWRPQHARPGLVTARTRRDPRLSCRRSDRGGRLDRRHPWT